MMHRAKTLCDICFLSLTVALWVFGNQAGAAVLEVSQPIKVTDSSYYERGQSLAFDGVDYLLFFGRSTGEQGWYQNGNPDVNDYEVYFKRATTVVDLAAATATKIPGPSNANSYRGETGAVVFAGEVWAFAAIDAGGTADVTGWYYDGAAWNEVASLVTGLDAGSAHHDETTFDGKLFVVVNRGNDFYTTYSTTPKTGGWSSEVAVGSTGGFCRFFVDGSSLYLGIMKSSAPFQNEIYQYESSTDTWALVASASSDGRELALLKAGGRYVLAQALSTSEGGGRQQVIQWSSDTLDTSFFAGGAQTVTEGRYGTNTWAEMWPSGFTDAGGTSYLFFTSERDLPSQEGTGNIWYLEVDWDLTGGHHTYLQEAVTAASAGDAIDVQAGRYEEQIHITTNLSITGAGVAATFIDAPVSLPLSFSAMGATNHPVVWIDGITDAHLADLTVDGLGRGNGNYRFSGVAYADAGGSLTNVYVANVRETPMSTADHGFGILCYQDALGPREVALIDVTCQGFQWEGLACGGNNLTVALDRVTVIGTGPTTLIPQIGIDLFAGVMATVTDCSVDEVTYTGPTWIASGVRVYASAVASFTGGGVTNCQSGVSLVDVSADFNGTSLSDCAEDAIYIFSSSGGKGGSPAATARLFGSLPHERGAKAAVTANLTDCVLSGAGTTGSYGMWIQSNGTVQVNLSGCILSDWERGFQLEEIGGTISGASHGNSILNNIAYGGWSNTAAAYDATGNWWGDTTGPENPTSNPGGLGNAVSDNILFDPFLTGNVVLLPDPLVISPADDSGGGVYSDSIVCSYLGGGSGPVYGFSIDVTWDGGVLDASPADFSRPDTGPFASATFFFVQPITGGVRIDTALGGDQPGTTADDLFQASFASAGMLTYASSELTLTLNSIRDGNNQILTGFTPDNGLVVVDLEPPAVADVAISNMTLAHTDDFVKDGDDIQVTATVTDAHPAFGAGGINADLSSFGFGTTVNPTIYDGTTAVWDLTGVTCSPSDGTIAVAVTATDPVGSVTASSDDIIADNTAPSPLTGLAALPGHRLVDLNWDDPTGNDIYFDGIVIRFVAWGDYPTYATPGPDYPANPNAGDGEAFNGTGTGAAHSFSTDDRDIYYYAGFVYDVARNYSGTEVGGGNQARSTNYWLGDVSDGVYGQYDGFVDVADITVLGSTYLLCSIDPGFKDEVDIGPTHDNSRIGIPTPDTCIDFEDLMIMAMNFSQVAPLKTPATGTPIPVLVWARIDADTWALQLLEPCANLKGLRLTAQLPLHVSVTVTAGELLNQQEALVFLRNAGPHTFDTSLAIMGTGVGLAGSGELLRAKLSTTGEIGNLVIDARGVENEVFVIEPEVDSTEDIPSVFQLAQNYPNPFNPLTKIVFSLPEAQSVQLTIFMLDGKRVATLASGDYPAGTHEVVWDGRDADQRLVASGTYFYRIEAGPYRRTMKMILMK